MLFRYLAVDEAGAFPLLSYQQLEPLAVEGVRLILLEATDDWPAALRAHQQLEARLRDTGPPMVRTGSPERDRARARPRRLRARA
jgi:hypothetical protein